MSDATHDFRYVMCPGSQPEPAFVHLHQQIYSCWELIWTKAFEELKVSKPLYSDPFTRQDYVGALFHKDKCVGMSFFRWAHATRADFAKDSYFANWSEDHLAQLSSRGPHIIVCSNYTVHPDARGTQLGLSTKDLLLGMIVETFMNSNADAMTGATRRDRKVNDVCHRWGAKEIAEEIPSGYGDTVDLVGFFKDHIAAFPPHILKPLAQKLWTERLEIGRVAHQQDYSHFKPLKVA